MSCSPTDCRDCCDRVESAPTDGVSPTADPAKRITCPRCKGACSVCGGDVEFAARLIEHGRRLERAAIIAEQQPVRWHE